MGLKTNSALALGHLHKARTHHLPLAAKITRWQQLELMTVRNNGDNQLIDAKHLFTQHGPMTAICIGYFFNCFRKLCKLGRAGRPASARASANVKA